MGKISEIFNFENIGGKIKNLAKWSCWITILLIWIAAPITFIALVTDDWTAYLCWIPLVSAIVGPVFVWISSWAMYAFGEFVEDIHAIRNKEGTTEGNAKREGEMKAKYEVEKKMRCKAEAKVIKTEPTKKAKQYMEMGVAPEKFRTGYICPVCKMTMDSMRPCERCNYVPPMTD